MRRRIAVLSECNTKWRFFWEDYRDEWMHDPLYEWFEAITTQEQHTHTYTKKMFEWQTLNTFTPLNMCDSGWHLMIPISMNRRVHCFSLSHCVQPFPDAFFRYRFSRSPNTYSFREFREREKPDQWNRWNNALTPCINCRVRKKRQLCDSDPFIEATNKQDSNEQKNRFQSNFYRNKTGNCFPQ